MNKKNTFYEDIIIDVKVFVLFAEKVCESCRTPEQQHCAMKWARQVFMSNFYQPLKTGESFRKHFGIKGWFFHKVDSLLSPVPECLQRSVDIFRDFEYRMLGENRCDVLHDDSPPPEEVYHAV